MITGSNTTVPRWNVPDISGLSGSSWTTSAKDTKSISNNKAITQQKEVKSSTSTPTTSSSTALLPPQTALPQKSVNTHHSSQPSHQVTARNPYVLIKKETFSGSIPKSVVPQKSALKWSKPSVSSVRSSENNKSLSDSELYTRKSNFPSTEQLPSSATVQRKVPSISNVQESFFKWSKTKSTASSTLIRSAKKSKPSRSKLKWTKPGASVASVEVGIKRKLNPYVLRKETTASRSAGQKQRVLLKEANKTKVMREPVHSMQKKILQNQVVYEEMQCFEKAEVINF